MIPYIDTGALIKKYVNEDGSEEVVRHWNSSEMIVVSWVAYAESFSAMNRKKREGVLSKEKYEIATEEFKTDWESFEKVEVVDQLNEMIEELTNVYPLRGFDAIHLASALCFQELIEESLHFICADRRLNEAAQEESLNVIDLS